MTDEAVTSGQTETSQAVTEAPAPAATDHQEVPATPSTPETSSKAPTIEETIRQVYDKNNRPRDPVTQRFTPYKGAQAEETPAETPVEETLDQPEAREKEPPREVIPDPMSWSSEMRARFAALPPEFNDVRKYVVERDKQAHEAISRAGQHIKAFEPIGKVLGQFKETFTRNNLHPAEAVARLLAVEANMEKDPVATLRQVAEAYGVDMRALAEQVADGAGEQPVADPRVQRLEAQLAAANQQLAQVTQYLTAQHDQRQNAGREALARQISDFAEARDAGGALLHPHLDRVSGTMAALMHADPNLDLEQAYSRAVRTDDELFAQTKAQEAAAAEARRQAEARKKAEEARKAAAVNVTSSPGSGKTPKSMDDTLREVALKAYGR